MSYEINELLNNHFIHDCCIVSEEYFFAIAEEYLTEDEYARDELGMIKLVAYDIGLFNSPPIWTYSHWTKKNSLYKPKIVNTKKDEALIISNGGLVFYHGLGNNKQFEENIPHKISAGCYSVHNIDGDVYVTGVYRNVAIRRGIDNWENLSSSIPPRNSSAGFLSVDGFDKNDLYAAGGENDVWRYDGQDWIPLNVADDFLPRVVCCCADDGYVYIAGAWGMVVRGREDKWEFKITDKNDSFLYTSMASYQGKILLGTESDGTYFIEHNADDFTPRPYDFDGEIMPFSSRYMDVGYGKLMVAGNHEIALHDGEKWEMLYNGGYAEASEEMLVTEDLHKKTEGALSIMSKLFKSKK